MRHMGREDKTIRLSFWYFHILNLLQFLPALQFGTVDGIKSGLYEPIEFKFGRSALGQPVGEESGYDPAVEQLLDMVHESVRDGLRNLVSDGILLPEAGYELQDGVGEIIADGELAWVKPQLVVLIAGQEAYRKEFEDNGWTVIQRGEDDGWVDEARKILLETIDA